MTPTTFQAPARLPGQPWDFDSAAAYLSVCRKTLERYARLKQIAVIRLGRRVLIADAELARVARTGFANPALQSGVATHA